MLAYLGWKLVDGRELSSSTLRGHLYRVTCPDHSVPVLMTFLACLFPPRELAAQDLPGRDTRFAGWETWRHSASTSSACA